MEGSTFERGASAPYPTMLLISVMEIGHFGQNDKGLPFAFWVLFEKNSIS